MAPSSKRPADVRPSWAWALALLALAATQASCSAGPGEDSGSCTARTDGDGDGFMGCNDPDCWGRCTPTCPPATSCVAGPRCGDGLCDVVYEDTLICGVDCT